MNVFYPWREAPKADFAVIGDPIDHSRSPQMHGAAYTALGLQHRYVAIHVASSEVGIALDHLKTLGYRGVNVTVPHKAEAMAWADEPDALSRQIGVVNTIDLLTGLATNTDAPGFMDTLIPFGLRADSSVLLIGAGGSARALAVILAASGFRVDIWNRTSSRAQELATEFGLRQVDQATADYDLVINTTSAGLSQETLPIDWSVRKPTTVAYDLVYGQTPFLSLASQLGLTTQDGKELLVAQGARSFRFWLGIDPPKDIMRQAIQ